MKNVILFLVCLLPLVVSAQVTNIQVRFTINGDSLQQTSLNLNATNKNEKALIEALTWHHTNTGGTNTLDFWAARVWTKDNLRVLKDAKDEQDAYFKALRFDVEFVLKFKTEDLTTQMKTNLEEVAALKNNP